MIRSLLSVLEEATLLVLPQGGQKTARRNAWRAAADLQGSRGSSWLEPVPITPVRPAPGPLLADLRRPEPALGLADLPRADLPRRDRSRRAGMRLLPSAAAAPS
ncbi:hypothetical protein MXD59_18675 [Frankia sp. Ag45/Mut15]|uniref:Uncharacterized protein n=1 Tax=Frankia umida TaxID=573489 RepID=A0ABT0K1W3_9ACTN|nr:hypothetical protein [Frankia umida]MCK9877774.1 hypothetical protein [Frankia umida]